MYTVPDLGGVGKVSVSQKESGVTLNFIVYQHCFC